MADYRRKVIEILEGNGCTFVRHATGSHDLSSRIPANSILKQAGLKDRL